MSAAGRKNTMAGLLIVAFLALVVAPFIIAEHGRRENAAAIAAQQKAINSLAQTVEDARGQGADVPPAAVIVDDVDGAEISEPITTGAPGPAGPAGEPGRAPTAEEIAAAVEEFCAERSACTGAQGEPGVDAVVSQAALLSAVTGYCAENDCTGAPGPAGPTGPQGRPPTAAEIAQAVTDYCAATDCTGPPGDDGATGPAGAQGETGPAGSTGPTGPAGPSPTQEQVNAAVVEYCAATGACVGPTGPTGPEGPVGPAGEDAREVVAIECDPITAHPNEPVTPQCRPVYG